MPEIRSSSNRTAHENSEERSKSYDVARDNSSIPQTCHESAEASKPSAERISGRILALAHQKGKEGLTINEAEDFIGGHKGHSVSPRFAVLVRAKKLVRIVVGASAPTNRHLKGRPIFKTRFDVHTKRQVVIHWLPEFAPTAEGFDEGEKVCA